MQELILNINKFDKELLIKVAESVFGTTVMLTCNIGDFESVKEYLDFATTPDRTIYSYSTYAGTWIIKQL